MPNQTAIRQWYIALKSGEYKQTRETLRNDEDEGYCCWGVACDLYAQSGIDPNARWLERPYPRRAFITSLEFAGRQGLPPSDIEDWLGIDVERIVEATVDGGQVEQTLAGLNDTGFTLSEIADVIWHNYGEGEPPNVG